MQMPFSRWILFALILLLGATSRSLHLADQSLWVDEGYAYYHAHSPSLVETLARDTHPPLYFGALRLWSEVVGDSELALRWLSLLPSMLSLAVIFQLSKEIIRHRQDIISQLKPVIPLLAMLMLALADAENFLAQEARHYTWLVLLVSFSMWFFLRWIRTQGRHAYGLWLVFTIAMVYTHYITAFIGVVQGIYGLIALSGKIRKRAIVGLILGALALMPWLLMVGLQQLGNNGANWSVPLNLDVIRDIQVKYFTAQWSLIIGLLILGCVSIIYQARDSFQVKFHRVTILLVLWLVLPFVLTVLVNEFLPFLQPRRLTQWSPVIALLVAFGLGNIRVPIRGLLMVMLLVYGVTSVDFYRVKPDWRTVADLTARYATSGQLVLTDIDGGDYQMQYYLTRDMPYGKLLDDGVRYESLKTQRDFYPATYHEWLPKLIDTHDTVWLMYWSDDTSARGWLENFGFQQTAHFTYSHDGGASGDILMSIFRFDRLSDDEAIAEFDSGMRLLSGEIDVDDLRLDLLWTSDTLLERDYTVSAKLLDEDGILVAQLDSQPQLNQRLTSTWQIDEIIFDPHELILREGTATLEAGDYQVIVQVYAMDDSSIVNIATTTDDEWFTLQSITIDLSHN